MQGPLDPPGFAPTGQRIDFSSVEFFEFTDTKVQRVELLFNVMELGAQVGATPAPGQPWRNLASDCNDSKPVQLAAESGR
jgi:hypothetical protein